MSDTFTTPKQMRVRKRLQEAWIHRYTKFFGTPRYLSAFRDGEMPFEMFYRFNRERARWKYQQIENVPKDAFAPEPFDSEDF